VGQSVGGGADCIASSCRIQSSCSLAQWFFL